MHCSLAGKGSEKDYCTRGGGGGGGEGAEAEECRSVEEKVKPWLPIKPSGYYLRHRVDVNNITRGCARGDCHMHRLAAAGSCLI